MTTFTDRNTSLVGQPADGTGTKADALAADPDRPNAESERLLVLLDEQRLLLEAVLDQMPAGVIIAEAPSGRLLLANRLATRFRHPLADNAGTAADDATNLTRWPISRAVSGIAVDGEEVRLQHGDGERVLLVSSAPIRDTTGIVVAAVCSMVDVTDRERRERLARLQQESARALADAAAPDQAAAQLLERVALELHTPVATLWLFDSDSDLLRVEAAWAAPEFLSIDLVDIARSAGSARGAGLVGRVWNELAPIWIEDIVSDGTVPQMAAAGLRCGFAVPIVVAATVIGVLEFFRSETSPIDRVVLDTLVPIGAQFGQFVERVRALQELEAGRARMTHLAQTLQASLIPPMTPQIPGLDLAGIYRPAGSGDEVGGDFYDVFEAAENDWGVVVGDVCGKGAEAAAVTALARYTIRAVALRTRFPQHILHTLNTAVRAQHPDQFMTVVYARVQIEDDGPIRVTIATGGHPLPLHASADGTITPVGTPGDLVGAFDDAAYHDAHLELGPGESLVFYTDGIDEGRNETGFYGMDRVCHQLRSVHGQDAATIAAHLVDDVVAFQGGFPRDDIAAVVLRHNSALA